MQNRETQSTEKEPNKYCKMEKIVQLLARGDHGFKARFRYASFYRFHFTGKAVFDASN